MSEMANTAVEVSEIREICISSRFEWKIPRLHSAVRRRGDVCRSRPHTFCNAEWVVTLTKDLFCVEVHLNRHASKLSHENNTVCNLFRIGSNGVEVFIQESRHKFSGEDMNLSVFTDYDYLRSDQRDFSLKITCLIECYHCKPEAPAVFRKCSGAIERDLLQLLISGEDSDVTIDVKDRVFNVHKMIIRARSPVFFSMLKHDMAEKNSGCIDIPDCDPEAFQKFLEHIYSGELKDLSQDVVCSLYYIADKYQVSEVKETCGKFMSENLSLEAFFDIAELSTLHEELELLERASQYFINNNKDIIQTDRWVTFLVTNPVVANGFLKTLLIPEVYQEKKRKPGSIAGKDDVLKKIKSEFN